jgi:hypothetical protein
MSDLSEQFNIGLEGHLRILGYDNGSDTPIELLNQRNAIHPENASIMIAGAIANRTTDGSIYSMYFGTGGATIDTLGTITYASPNTTGTASLHNEVYFEVVDDNSNAPTGNQMAVKHAAGNLFSDVEIRCVIAASQPTGQSITDSVSGTDLNTAAFVFDEIGLKTSNGLLVTHVVFSPIEKSFNRIIEVVYVLRVTVNQV